MGEHRLTADLRALLASRRTAALGTCGDDGAVFVSMVPFAIDSTAQALVLHVSSLAAHTRNMAQRPDVSLLVCAAEVEGEPVHALPRVTLDAIAHTLPTDSPPAQAARAVYLQRFPEAEPMTRLGDFRFVQLALRGARQVAGFGAARSLGADELRSALRPEGP